MRMYFADQTSAETKADQIHTWLSANDPAYAASVAAGQTLKWDIPHQDDSSRWFIGIEERCYGALTTLEIAALVEG